MLQAYYLSNHTTNTHTKLQHSYLITWVHLLESDIISNCAIITSCLLLHSHIITARLP